MTNSTSCRIYVGQSMRFSEGIKAREGAQNRIEWKSSTNWSFIGTNQEDQSTQVCHNWAIGCPCPLWNKPNHIKTIIINPWETRTLNLMDWPGRIWIVFFRRDVYTEHHTARFQEYVEVGGSDGLDGSCACWRVDWLVTSELLALQSTIYKKQEDTMCNLSWDCWCMFIR